MALSQAIIGAHEGVRGRRARPTPQAHHKPCAAHFHCLLATLARALYEAENGHLSWKTLHWHEKVLTKVYEPGEPGFSQAHNKPSAAHLDCLLGNHVQASYSAENQLQILQKHAGLAYSTSPSQALCRASCPPLPALCEPCTVLRTGFGAEEIMLGVA